MELYIIKGKGWSDYSEGCCNNQFMEVKTSLRRSATSQFCPERGIDPAKKQHQYTSAHCLAGAIRMRLSGERIAIPIKIIPTKANKLPLTGFVAQASALTDTLASFCVLDF